MPSSEAQAPNITRQVHHARSHLLLTLAHMGVPWAVFAAVTIVGNALYVVLGRVIDHGQWADLATGLLLAAGLAAAALDLHLRRHRMSLVGRYIGPATTGAGTAMTAAFLQSGYSVPLALLWIFGGFAACTGWDAWLHHAPHHDLTIGFTANAQKSGLGEALFAPARKAKKAGTAPARTRPVVTGRVRLPGGEVTPHAAAERAAELEGAHHWPPGSASLVPNAEDAADADFTLSHPAALAQPLPWPGPSAPGAPMSVPFRLGGRQDGEVFFLRMTPVRHTRVTGMTGSGKTMSFLYNRAAEGITRQGYALFGIDLTKRWQFLGPLRPALHGAAVDPVAALRLMAGLERVRQARMDYMAGRNITEWAEDCGLSYMDIAMEELGEILALLKETAKGQPGAPFDIGTWLTNVRAARSSGMSWNTSNQSGKHTSFPTDARGSFYPLTFGLTDANDVAPALSERQAQAGCRPTLWADRVPGMAYVDHPGMPENTFSIPVRFYDWGQSGEQMAAYASEWPAAARPLDDISGEALENEPSLPPSYTLPGPGGTLPGRGRGDRTVVAGPWGRPQPPAEPTAGQKADMAIETVRRHLADLYVSGTTIVTFDDLTKAGLWGEAGKGAGGTTNRTRTWGYNALKDLTAFGYLQESTGARKRWKILPSVVRPGEAEQA
jgi:hypothetical protein